MICQPEAYRSWILWVYDTIILKQFGNYPLEVVYNS
jgi:hypothetical protein